MTPREVLLLPMRPNDAGALSVGGYLQSLVRAVWNKGEGFSGKRPFGNSGWEYDLYYAVIAGGASTGTLFSEEDVGKECIDEIGDAREVVLAAIDALFPEPWVGAEAARIAAAALRAKAEEIDAIFDKT